MFHGEEDSAFQNLPPEMIVEVLTLVDVEGKQSARLVCRRWRWILDHPDSGLVCFKLNDEKMTKDSIQCLLKSQLHIDHLILQDIKVTWPSMTYSRNKFPQIRKLTLRSGNSNQSVMTILQYGCAQTGSLTLSENCLSQFRLDLLSRILSGMRWNQMTKLSLRVDADVTARIASQENNVKGMELILKEARIPNLRKLTLDLLSFGDDEFSNGITRLMSNFMTFLEHHSKTLKELNLWLRSDRDEILISPNISAGLFSAEQQKSIARDLKLECLDITTTHFHALLHIVPPFIWQLDNLVKLDWSPQWDQSWSLIGRNWIPDPTPEPKLMAPPGTLKPMQSLIQRNRNTLTKVTATFVCGDIDVDPFELSWLESCPHLSELTIDNCVFLGVKLQLPTVRKLDIGLFEDFNSIENTSTWISKTFRNLETVQFSVYFGPQELQNSELNWIQNLLFLPRLGEIRFRFTYDGFEESDHPFTGPNLIRQYCCDKARLMFRGERQRGRPDQFLPSGPCVIKILPIQNSN